jgi:hypothetical protein
MSTLNPFIMLPAMAILGAGFCFLIRLPLLVANPNSAIYPRVYGRFAWVALMDGVMVLAIAFAHFNSLGERGGHFALKFVGPLVIWFGLQWWICRLLLDFGPETKRIPVYLGPAVLASVLPVAVLFFELILSFLFFSLLHT